MALHSQLPIYKVARDLFYQAVTFNRKIPRELRNSVGSRLVGDTFELVMLVFRANSATDKRPYLDNMIEQSVAAGMLFRLCFDFHIINEKEYATATELTNSIGKQANGWRRSQK